MSGAVASGVAGSPTTAPGTTTALGTRTALGTTTASGATKALGQAATSGSPAPGWVGVCRVADLEPERGAAALLGDEQLALVRLLDDRVLAVQQLDPFSGAHVMSRGIVGSRLVEGEVRPTLASPMYKQVFDLETGECLDPVGAVPVAGGAGALRTWTVRVVDGEVQVRLGADGVGGET